MLVSSCKRRWEASIASNILLYGSMHSVRTRFSCTSGFADHLPDTSEQPRSSFHLALMLVASKLSILHPDINELIVVSAGPARNACGQSEAAHFSVCHALQQNQAVPGGDFPGFTTSLCLSRAERQAPSQVWHLILPPLSQTVVGALRCSHAQNLVNPMCVVKVNPNIKICLFL